jgi:tryptophan synthase alpha chain
VVKNGIDRVFETLKTKNQKALIPYLAAGYPALEEEEALIALIKKEGANILELGIPFSDPIADGPTIQFASQEALKNGVSVKKILHWMKSWKDEINVPTVIMSYINPILAFGLKKFSEEASRAGVTGLIIPDLIPEESDEIRAALEKKGIHLIHLVAPTTPTNRQVAIAKKTDGFLYAVSVVGVTGARRALPKATKSWLGKLRTMSSKPVCVGFGISGPDQIRELRNSVDGFIVGSALIDVIRKNKSYQQLGKMKKFVTTLSKECFYAR